MEIALRIVYAIEHDERFAAYLLIPLHPERPGPQRSLIMLYTWHTIIMMYRLTQPPVLLLLPGCLLGSVGLVHHVMSCHVTSRHVMSPHVMSCHVMSCHVMLLLWKPPFLLVSRSIIVHTL